MTVDDGLDVEARCQSSVLVVPHQIENRGNARQHGEIASQREMIREDEADIRRQ